MTWHGYRMRYDKAYKKANTYSPPKTEEKSGANSGFNYTTPPIISAPIKRAGKKVGRNEPCPCGSGKKYKKCCMRK